MLDSFALRLAAKENEKAMLRGQKKDDNNNEPPTTSSSQGSPVPPVADKDARIMQLEQQNADADTLDLNGENVPDEKIVEIAYSIKNRQSSKGQKRPHREQPLFSALDGIDPELEATKPEDQRNNSFTTGGSAF